ncbi:MAG: tetratricopeptide repeat protein, partial [Anaerolineae bacterium]
LYLGLPVDKPAHQINTVLTLFPLWAFWAAIAVALYALGLMMILYLRVPFGHLLYLLNAGLMLTVGVLGVIIPQAGVLRCGGGLGLLLGVVQLVITLNLWKDFTVVETRLRLKVDSDARNTTSLLLSGRKYAGLGMWGNAVIHLRRAAARRPADLSIRLLLIAAYLNLKRFDLAETALQQAEQMDPANVDLQRLRDKLAAAQRAA